MDQTQQQAMIAALLGMGSPLAFGGGAGDPTQIPQGQVPAPDQAQQAAIANQLGLQQQMGPQAMGMGPGLGMMGQMPPNLNGPPAAYTGF